MVHREHAVVETGGVRTAKTMGLRNLPPKAWQLNCGWVLAANIAADLTAWTRLLGASATTRTCRTPTRTRSDASGTSPPAWPGTPASAS